MMDDLYAYTDYRQFLQDHVDWLRSAKPGLSLRYVARRLGLDPGNLVKVLNRERHLPRGGVDEAVGYFRFDQKQAEFFRTLVAFGRAKKEAEVSRLFQRLCAMKTVEAYEMSGAMAEFYSKWYHSAICGLLAVIDFENDYAHLAQSVIPPITTTQARQSIALLKRLTIIDKDSRGHLKPVHSILSTGDKWYAAAITEFQRQMLALAGKALDDLPKKERDISTLSFAVSQQDFAEIKSLTAEYRKSVLRIADNCAEPDRVYQLNIQIFPLSGDRRNNQ